MSRQSFNEDSAYSKLFTIPSKQMARTTKTEYSSSANKLTGKDKRKKVYAVVVEDENEDSGTH